MRYLITPTLLNAWVWFFRIQNQEDFLKTLGREPIKENEALAKGRQFERHIQLHDEIENIIYRQHNEAYANCVKEIADKVKGGTWQVSGKKEIVIGDMTFLLYGRADVLKADTIYDIKYTKYYADYCKYRKSMQHLLYFEIFPEMNNFEYLVSDLKNVYIEHYHREDSVKLLSEISDFIIFVRNNEKFGKVFFDKWEAM
jgi:hypothetical protein